MKRMLFGLAAACALALGGCASGGAKDPANTTANIDAAYSVVKITAALYVALPDCGPGASKVCADAAIKAQIDKALAVADVAVAEARRQILAAPDQSTVATWTSRALSAVAVLAAALKTYGVERTG